MASFASPYKDFGSQTVFSVIRSWCIPYSAWEPENRNFLQPRAFAVRIVSREISIFFS